MKIQNKLFLILFSFSLLLVSTLVFLMQWSIGKGMVDYVNTKEVEALKPIGIQLADKYRETNSWRTMEGEHSTFYQLISAQLSGSDFSLKPKGRPPEHRSGGRKPRMDRPPRHREYKGGFPDDRPARRPPPPHHFEGADSPAQGNNFPKPPSKDQEAHYALLNTGGGLVAGKYFDDIEYSKTDITVNSVVVGYLAISKRNHLTQGYEVDFIEEQQHYLWIIALFSMLLVTIVTLPLARHLVEPIKLIARGMHKLTQGEYQQSIDVKRQDELGELSRDYNELALTLKENETARKRWLANISHELRTPVAILRGELEAMLDKVRPLTVENIGSANDEVIHLQRLIDDLNLLTSADIGGMHYRKKNESLPVLLADVNDKYTSYLQDAGIQLTVNIAENTRSTTAFIDRTRICQLFENIINNCVKYSSAKQLVITLAIENNNENSTAIISFEDDGVGVSDEHLPHLFEHLYRVDDSRNRKLGGTGLGLSICKHIVIAHEGEISAKQASLGGVAMIIVLPMLS